MALIVILRTKKIDGDRSRDSRCVRTDTVMLVRTLTAAAAAAESLVLVLVFVFESEVVEDDARNRVMDQREVNRGQTQEGDDSENVPLLCSP